MQHKKAGDTLRAERSPASLGLCFRSRFLFLVRSLLAPYGVKRNTSAERSQLQNHPIFCKTASKDVLRGSENYLLRK